MNAPISIVIADDHTLFREGVRRLLEREQDIEVQGEAGNGAEAVELVAAAGPDVVLLDVKMPGDGVSMTVRRMKQISPRTVVIILTMCDESSLVRRLIEEGIGGYLLKSVTGGELVAAIRSARSGGRLTLAVSDRSMWEHRDGDLLSRREREILELAARALSNAQIADRLFVAEATVKRHLHNAFRKLGAVSRIERGQQGQGGLDDLHGRGVRAGAGTPAGQDRPERPAGTAQNARRPGPPRMPAGRDRNVCQMCRRRGLPLEVRLSSPGSPAMI